MYRIFYCPSWPCCLRARYTDACRYVLIIYLNWIASYFLWVPIFKNVIYKEFCFYFRRSTTCIGASNENKDVLQHVYVT